MPFSLRSILFQFACTCTLKQFPLAFFFHRMHDASALSCRAALLYLIEIEQLPRMLGVVVSLRPDRVLHFRYRQLLRPLLFRLCFQNSSPWFSSTDSGTISPPHVPQHLSSLVGRS